MSVTLFVRLNRPIKLEAIEGAVACALRELLNLERTAVVVACSDDADQRPSNGVLAEGSSRVVCSLGESNEKVVVTPIRIPVQVATDGGSYCFADRDFLSIARHSGTSPLSWALVGAVALGIARSVGSEIEDNAGFFTDANVQGPDEFYRALSVSTPQADLKSAAEALYGRMPKPTQVSEWLEKQLT
jgi:hypothetical protein